MRHFLPSGSCSGGSNSSSNGSGSCSNGSSRSSGSSRAILLSAAPAIVNKFWGKVIIINTTKLFSK